MTHTASTLQVSFEGGKRKLGSRGYTYRYLARLTADGYDRIIDAPSAEELVAIMDTAAAELGLELGLSDNTIAEIIAAEEHNQARSAS